MSKYYEGKIGIGQIIFCLVAAATLFIPLAINPSIVFAFSKIMPIGNTSEIAQAQMGYSFALFQALNVADQIPETVYEILPYAIYAFYGILAFDLLFALILMILRSEVLRQIVRAISILLGFAMIAITVANLPAIAGFFTYYLGGGFGETPIFDCILNSGLLYYLGLFIFSILLTVKQFSSFFGKSH